MIPSRFHFTRLILAGRALRYDFPQAVRYVCDRTAAQLIGGGR